MGGRLAKSCQQKKLDKSVHKRWVGGFFYQYLPTVMYIPTGKSVLLIRLKRESRKPQSINKKIVDMKTDTLLPFIGNLNEF